MVLLVMLDGARGDAVESGKMPNLVGLTKNEWQSDYRCAWSLAASVSEIVDPVSAPNHVSIATGVTPDRHGVRGNGWTKKGLYAEYPTWLQRVVNADPRRHALFAFSWFEDAQLGPSNDVTFVSGSDPANAVTVSTRLAAADAPDATMYVINCPDSGGHATGYYPRGAKYSANLAAADSYIGMCLKAIAGRPTFAKEDWLVIVTSDHGGFLRSHGKSHGHHALTVPVLVVGRNVTAGHVRAPVFNYDPTANALAHFGIDAAAHSLNARAVTGSVEKVRPLSDGLAVYLPFDNFGNCAPNTAVTARADAEGLAAVANDGFSGKGLKIAAGGRVLLEGSEKLAFEDGGRSFAAVVWVRQDQSRLVGDPLIFGNKNWQKGANAGLALVSSGKITGKRRGVVFNYVTGSKRRDLGQFFSEDASKWTFYAVTRTDDGSLVFYQGRSDGRLHWIAADAAELTLSKTGLPFCLGSDGTGEYTHKYAGELDEFALWTRGLAHEEVRRIYEAGRCGQELRTLLK